MFDGYTDTVLVGTESVKIDPDFRIMMSFETGVQQSDTAVIMSAVSDFFKGDIPADIDSAVEAVIDFYLCGEHPQDKGKEAPKKCYDFKEDMRYFIAAFRQQYGIDLNAVQLHWQEFCDLFSGLTESTELVKIMQIRCTDLNKISFKPEKERIKRLQEHYALKQYRRKRYSSAAERDRAMIEAAKKRLEEIKRSESNG